MHSLSDLLSADHAACDAAWTAVEAAAHRGDHAALAAALQAFDARTRRHLDLEERAVFPRFEEATGMIGGPTAVMRAEHAQMRGLLDQMGRALAAGDADLVLDHGDTLLMITQQHNRKEEGVLYPMCDRVLVAELGELLAEVEAALA